MAICDDSSETLVQLVKSGTAAQGDRRASQASSCPSAAQSESPASVRKETGFQSPLPAYGNSGRLCPQKSTFGLFKG